MFCLLGGSKKCSVVIAVRAQTCQFTSYLSQESHFNMFCVLAKCSVVAYVVQHQCSVVARYVL
jgi:hypothetical protein